MLVYISQITSQVNSANGIQGNKPWEITGVHEMLRSTREHCVNRILQVLHVINSGVNMMWF
jgi:hypothetical protein